MKISFSTLACPDWTMPQITQFAASVGYDGVELRFVEGEDSLWKLDSFSKRSLPGTKRAIVDHNLIISCVDTSCRFHSPDAQERGRWIEEGQRMSDLAAELSAPGIRVFGDTIQPCATRDSTRGWIIDSILQLSEVSGAKGVQVWLESHGDFSSAPETNAIIAACDPRFVGAVWDPVNSFTSEGERPTDGAETLGPSIRHVHIKDVQHNADLWKYVLTGNGDFPLNEVRTAMQQLPYDSFLSFEWERKWHPELEGPELALPHFVNWFHTAYANV